MAKNNDITLRITGDFSVARQSVDATITLTQEEYIKYLEYCMSEGEYMTTPLILKKLNLKLAEPIITFDDIERINQ